MTAHHRFAAALRTHRLLAILRSTDATALTAAMSTLVQHGIRALEVTLPTPGSLRAITHARSTFGDDVLVGAGTVMTPDDARRAADAGAEFVVSPHLDPATLTTAAELGLATLPGVFTPTEAVTARNAGATAVKLFPAGALGPGFAAALHGPLPHLPLVATGGIGIADVTPWLTAGAVAVAVGSPLLGDALEGGSLDDLARRTAAFTLEAAGGTHG